MIYFSYTEGIFFLADFNVSFLEREKSYRQFISSIVTRCRTQFSKAEKSETDDFRNKKDTSIDFSESMHVMERKSESGSKSHGLVEDSLAEQKWKLELDWLPKALEPALQLFRSALTTGKWYSQN